MSTHAIGPVRLLLGSLVLMAMGAGLCWWLYAGVPQDAVLVVRDGSFEVEAWSGTLRPSGSDLAWDHAPSAVELSIARSSGDEEEFQLGTPLPLNGVKTIRIDFRVAGTMTVTDAVRLSFTDGPLLISVRDGQLERRGDVWVHQGFVLEGRKRRFHISKIECLGADGTVLARYQNPDQGRRVRFRLKLTASAR